ncbi:MAG: UDP-N-acetylmuramoyl-tripeptide--D-alanyl-D-alanine ligase, partial [Chryseobacterium sp.]|nr:UDP-N-acetylmuramoyl-tripeptide--D-alanyl-D-alanine ligase [Chryseobacterium sp.]
ANPTSMAEALKNFQSFEGSKTIIIGDMLELGEESLHEHTAILEMARDLGFDEIITVGKHFSETGISEKSYENTEALISAVKNQPIISKNVLLKASRGIALERILEHI